MIIPFRREWWQELEEREILAAMLHIDESEIDDDMWGTFCGMDMVSASCVYNTDTKKITILSIGIGDEQSYEVV